MGTGQSASVRCKANKKFRFTDHWQRSAAIALAILPLLILYGCAGLVGGKPQTTQGASFSITPTILNFGKVVSGQKSSQNVTLTNTGNVTAAIQQVTFSNPQFGMSGVTLPMSLAAGQSTSLSVWFNGTASGNVNGILTIQGESGSRPVTANLSGTVTTSSQPQISGVPTSLDLGTITIGSKGTANFFVGNTGSSDLTVSMITLNGPEFGLTGIATPKKISAGQTVPVTVTFTPTSAGTVLGSIALTSNDPSSPITTVFLNGTGSTTPVGHLTANPAGLAFSSVAVGSNASQNLTLTNSGQAAVHVGSITAVGSGFSVSGISVPTTLAPSQTATLSVKFAPIASGNATGTLKVTSDAPGSPLTLNLTGDAVQTGLAVSPSIFNFGSVVDGETKSQSFTITNTGTSPLTLTQISAIGSGYSVSGLNTPTTIAMGRTATFSVLFAPTTAGSLGGNITIASNAPNSPNTVALSGTGVAAAVTISASPTSLSFASVSAGSSSTKSVTLTNSGNLSTTIALISVNAKDVVISGITTPMTLAPGQNASMNLTFNPKSAETVTGNVTVTSTGGSSVAIPLTANGVQAGLTVTPPSVNFGNVTVGVPNSQTIQLGNNGTGVLTVTQLSVTGSGGFTNSAVSLPLSLSPGATSTFNIQFAPQVPGSVSGGIAIVSNAPTSPNTIPLTGNGVAATTTIALSSSSLSFGSVSTASAATQNITITDTGNANVTISGVSISGTGFALSGVGTPVTLAPSQQLTFGVRFSPSVAGTDTGSVTIASNATGSPAMVTLSGTGVTPTQHSVALTWNASTSAVAGYNAYRTSVSGSGYSKMNSSLVGGLSYIDSTVQSSQTYYYVTTAVDSSGNESGYSNEVQAVIP